MNNESCYIFKTKFLRFITGRTTKFINNSECSMFYTFITWKMLEMLFSFKMSNFIGKISNSAGKESKSIGKVGWQNVHFHWKMVYLCDFEVALIKSLSNILLNLS
ncbi:hypothetical protein ENBRE01_1460 [Enteropsectra breve]|nr:hypothetical protein ENBRE01_1460 [Enteropsectra breve]